MEGLQRDRRHFQNQGMDDLAALTLYPDEAFPRSYGTQGWLGGTLETPSLHPPWCYCHQPPLSQSHQG